MLLILANVEIAGCLAMASVIAWLRRLSGQRNFGGGIAYFLPFGAALFFVLTLLVAFHWMMTGRQPESSMTLLRWALVWGVILAALAVWLVVEARRYGARQADAHDRTRSRSRLQ